MTMGVRVDEETTDEIGLAGGVSDSLELVSLSSLLSSIACTCASKAFHSSSAVVVVVVGIDCLIVGFADLRLIVNLEFFNFCCCFLFNFGRRPSLG